MSNVWITADTHFGHISSKGGIIAYCNRPFSSIEEMDETLIKNWNSLVLPNDNIYHVGDICLKSDFSKYLDRLNGKIHLVYGNHDKYNILKHSKIIEASENIILKIANKIFDIHHYSKRVWYNSHYNTYHLYAHSHGRLPQWGKSVDVGVDSKQMFSDGVAKYRPFHLEEILMFLEKAPDNFNLIKNV